MRDSSTGAWSLLGASRSWCRIRDLWESSCQSIFSGASATRVLSPTVKGNCGGTSIAPVPMAVLLCAESQWTLDLVCTLQEWSLCFPQSCGAPALRSCWPSKKMLWLFFLSLSDLQTVLEGSFYVGMSLCRHCVLIFFDARPVLEKPATSFLNVCWPLSSWLEVWLRSWWP